MTTTKEFLQYFRDLTHARVFQRNNKNPDEIELFRSLTESLTIFKNIAVTETHGNVAQVKVYHPFPNLRSKCEIGDFITIWFSSSKEIRISIVQAKYEKSMLHGYPNYRFKTDSTQHYLMSILPPIVPHTGYLWKFGHLRTLKHISPEISLFQYGVFYDSRYGWDMASVSAELAPHYSFGKQNNSLKFSTYVLKQLSLYYSSSFATSYEFLSFGINLRRYTNELLNGRIGMPILIKDNMWLYSLINNMQSKNLFGENEAVQEFLDIFRDEVESLEEVSSPHNVYPTIILINGSKKNESY